MILIIIKLKNTNNKVNNFLKINNKINENNILLTMKRDK